MSRSPRWKVLINPTSLRGKKERLWREFRESLQSYEIQFDELLTEYSGHAAHLIHKSIKEGSRHFAVVGGDGSVHDAVNGLMNLNHDNIKVTLTQIPTGTGNDWFRSLGIKGGFNQLIQLIKRNQSHPHDIGRAELSSDSDVVTRYFITTAGVGFDGAVAAQTHSDARAKQVGRFRYLENIFRCLGRFEPVDCIVQTDSTELRERVFSINIGVTRFTGGGMRVTPDAIPDDGLFDITLIKALSKLNITLSFPLLYAGKIRFHPKASTFRAERVFIDTQLPLDIHLDGEVSGHTPVSFSILKHAIDVIAPW